MRPPRGGGWRGADGAGDVGDQVDDAASARPRLANPYDLSTWTRSAAETDEPGAPAARSARTPRRGTSSASATPLPLHEMIEDPAQTPAPAPRPAADPASRPSADPALRRAADPASRPPARSTMRAAPVGRELRTDRDLREARAAWRDRVVDTGPGGPVGEEDDRRPGPPPEELVDPPELARQDDPFELARRTVNRSRAAARDRGLFPISAKTQARRDVRDRSGRSPGYSGARPDPRDPQGVERVLRRVLSDLGWNEGMSTGRVLEEWDEIVGERVAAHCRPVSFEEGVLVVSASSSAWASQLRMLTPQIVTSIEKHVGAHVVSEMRVTGPAAAERSWKRGRRTVTWRGPRDTYG
ncbi:DUF721 domain-containing protein [Brachybacterium sp. DNPG3]